MWTFNYWVILFVMFMAFSFVGYIVEIIDVYIEKHRLMFSRGFLIGPYIPIYGIGALIMYLFLSRYKEDYFVLFTTSMLICSFLEYIVSYAMEKIFHLRWWDYSDKKFNINGRIYLLNSILFGVSGLIVCSFFGPWLYEKISNWSLFWLYIIAGTLLVIFVVDIIVSNVIVTKLKHRAYEYTEIDATGEIKERIVLELKKHLGLYSRVFKAFPNIFSFDSRLKEINNIINRAKKELKNIKDKFRSMML